MPTIDLFKGNTPEERSTPEEVTRVVASYMLFPDDRDRAIEHFVKLWLLADKSLKDAPNDERRSIPVSWIKALVAGPSLDEMEAERLLRLRSGHTAGALLLAMFVTSRLGHKLSLNRAIHLVERSRMADPKSYLNLYPNRPDILKAWKLMRPVAHLFAAQITTSAMNLERFVPTSADALQGTLQLSNAFLEWATAETLQTKDGGREPILDRATAWAMSQEDFPSKGLGPVDRSNLPSWMRSAVDNYSNR